MTKPRYPSGCSARSQVPGGAAGVASVAWNVNANNGNVNNNHRNNTGFGLAVRRVGEFQDAEALPLEHLYRAWRRARRQKVPSHNQLAFELDWSGNLIQLQEELLAGTWRPRPTTCFIATRPKAREIHAPDFSDRVVHHWLVPQLEAIYEPLFIADSYANRKGKGSHAAVRRVQAFVRQVDSGQGGGWYLKLDVWNCFNQIDRRRLWGLLKPRLARAGATPLVQQVTHALLRHPPLSAGVRIRATPAERAQVPLHKRLENAGAGRGLPVGNLSSQFLANVYLHELDLFAKHVLRARRYVRYVDDFVLVHQDRAVLEGWKVRIEQFLGERLGLRLKDAGELKPLTDGIDFLGYVIRPRHTLARRRVVAHAREALASWESLYVRGERIRATPAELRAGRARLASYAGHLRHARSHRLMSTLLDRFPWIDALSRSHRFPPRAEGRVQSIRFRNGDQP